MTYVVSGRLDFDGDGAKAELKDVTRAQDDLKKSSQGVSSAGRKVATETKKVKAAAQGAAGSVDMLSDAEREAARQAITLGQANGAAAGQMGNLTAQFNDIGVMLMAGQNPLQLAVQQGTQITQVIGPMGAAGAVGALKSAFVGMLNPVSLVTIGSIAAGAAMIQWLTGASEEAETLDDILESLAENTDHYRAKVTASAKDLREEFGNISTEVAQMLRDLQVIGLDKLIDDAGRAGEALKSNLLEGDDLTAAFGRIATFGRGGGSHVRSGTSMGIESDLAELGETKNIEDAIRVIERIQVAMTSAATATGGWTDDQRRLYDQTVLVEEQLRRAASAQNAFLQAGSELGASLLKNAQDYLRTRIAEHSKAQEILTTLNEENAIRSAIAQFGAQSVEVAEMRLSAERRAKAQSVEAQEISETMKANIMAAWDAAKGVASVDMAGNISLAADEAHRLLLNLAKASVPGGRGSDPRQFENDRYWREKYFPNPEKNKKPTSKRGGSDQQAKALGRLIAQQERQLAILRETDPVQRELLRYREAMSGATEAERRALSDLIGTRLEEEAALGRTQEQRDLFSSTTFDALDGLIFQGETMADVWDSVAASLGRAALQAALLGTGPLSGLFGATGGGLLNTLGDALFGGGLAAGAASTAGAVAAAAGMSASTANVNASPVDRAGLAATAVGAPPVASPVQSVASPLPSASTAAGASGQAVTIVRIEPSREFNAIIEEKTQGAAVDVVTEYNRVGVQGAIASYLEDPRRAG